MSVNEFFPNNNRARGIKLSSKTILRLALLLSGTSFRRSFACQTLIDWTVLSFSFFFSSPSSRALFLLNLSYDSAYDYEIKSHPAAARTNRSTLDRDLSEPSRFFSLTTNSKTYRFNIFFLRPSPFLFYPFYSSISLSLATSSLAISDIARFFGRY